MAQRAPVGVELLARLEGDQVAAALRVGQLDRSPGASGPRCATVMPVRVRVVGFERHARRTRGRRRGGQHAVHLAGGLDQEVLGGRGRGGSRRAGPSPARSADSTRLGLERAGQRARLDPRPALLRGGHHRGLVDDRDRLVLVVDDHHRAGLGLVGPPDRLGQRGVRGTGTARRASRRACSAGSRSRNLAARMACAGAGPHEDRDHRQPEHRYEVRRRSRSPALSTNGSDEQADGERPAGPGGRDGAGALAAGELPDTARSIRPPSSGRPGSRLKTPTIRLAQHQLVDQDAGRCRPARPRASGRTRRPPGPARAPGRPRTTRNSRPGVGGSRSISENPPSG